MPKRGGGAVYCCIPESPRGRTRLIFEYCGWRVHADLANLQNDKFHFFDFPGSHLSTTTVSRLTLFPKLTFVFVTAHHVCSCSCRGRRRPSFPLHLYVDFCLLFGCALPCPQLFRQSRVVRAPTPSSKVIFATAFLLLTMSLRALCPICLKHSLSPTALQVSACCREQRCDRQLL